MRLSVSIALILSAGVARDEYAIRRNSRRFSSLVSTFVVTRDSTTSRLCSRVRFCARALGALTTGRASLGSLFRTYPATDHKATPSSSTI
ncbi:hypothetical protein OpiT1DRAFT_03856 [Opitutaceae bacterium TAV1]|nr:hypothetical protein OpiT1DRAFT_03856 [Opitutaceae bacterium TAV1]